ncbi:MAG: acyl-CoA thioesterase [Pseudomonadota bacterium]
MYPVLRLVSELLRHRNAPPLGVGETHVTHLTCLPWDIDPFLELNNGRTLTLYDLGRFVLFNRLGYTPMMRANRMVGTVAGASIRYRRRIRMFDRFELRTRLVGWDDRFSYVEQSMWRKGEACSHILLRLAVTDANGLVPTTRLEEIAGPLSRDLLPEWARAWADADARRPWPPMND